MRLGLRPVAEAAILLILVSCGDDTNFRGSAGAQGARSRVANAETTDDRDSADAVEDTDDETAADLGTGSPYAALRWFWQCESAPVPLPPPATSDEVVVEGGGVHQFEADRLDGAPLFFEGMLCEPEQLARDIVFVVDTSGSMNENDPRIGDSCGRLAAIDAVLASLPQGRARVGLVTFNSLLDRNSTALFDSRDALFNNLAGTGNVADVVCNSIGGTNYGAGLGKASDLLSVSGRAKATKEIYFISDGQPNLGQDGINLANTLKTQGVPVGGQVVPVTIATIMLAGTDTVLESFIASRGPDGKPLHAFAAQTGQLAQALSSLVANGVAGAQLAWRAIGTTQWTTVDLLDNLQGFNFILPSFNIVYSDMPQGLEVRYEYFDKHDNRYSNEGRLLWTAAKDERSLGASTGR